MNERMGNGVRKKLVTAVCVCMLVAVFITIPACSNNSKQHPWKDEYEHCLEVIEYKIDNYRKDDQLSERDERERKKKTKLWMDFMRDFEEYVETCVENESENVGSSEEIYRWATLLLIDAYDDASGKYYMYISNYELDMEKSLNDWEEMIAEGSAIDNEILFGENFDEEILSEMLAGAWEEEFNNCLESIREDVKQSDAADKDQILNVLQAHENFIRSWVSYEIDSDGISSNEIMNDRKWTIFQIGTLLLKERYTAAGGEYEFIYDYEKDRQNK